MKTIVLLLLLFTVTLAAQKQHPITEETVSEDERIIYAAVLDQLWELKSTQHPVISDYTSTFDCKGACNGMRIGGCNGMRNEDESPAETLVTVCNRGLKQMPTALKSQFIAKNLHCTRIRGAIPSKNPYHYFSLTDARLNESIPKSWDHPDYVYFSRVAFDRSKKMALVYFGFMSGTDGSKSGGFYSQLDYVGSSWKISSSVQFWNMETPSGL